MWTMHRLTIHKRGFVSAIDLPDSTLSRYVELSSGKKNEVAFKVPRVFVRSAIVQIYRFGPKSYKYFSVNRYLH